MKLLPAMRDILRTAHYSPRTEKQYLHWVRRYVRFHGLRHPGEMGGAEVGAFLSDLAVRGHVSDSTQSQALAALLFLYRKVLRVDIPWVADVVRAREAHRVPVVMSREEVGRVLSGLEGTPRLIATLLYGGGLRLTEAVRLRVYDLDFDSARILVRAGKGNKDRYTVLPQLIIPALRTHLDRVRPRWQADRDATPPVRTHLPGAIERKFVRAEAEWGWQWVFPAARVHLEGSGVPWRHHIHPTVVQRAVREAVLQANIGKRASCHTFRHSFATHLLQDGYESRTVQVLMGHRDLKTTETYLHVLNRKLGVKSPADGLAIAEPLTDVPISSESMIAERMAAGPMAGVA